MTLYSAWNALVNAYGLAIFAYVIMSWFSPSGVLRDIYRLLGTICEPYISLFRRFLPVISMGAAGFDLSPMIAWLVLQVIIGPLVGAILLRVGL